MKKRIRSTLYWMYPRKTRVYFNLIPDLKFDYIESGNHPDPKYVDKITTHIEINVIILGFGFCYRGEWFETREIIE